MSRVHEQAAALARALEPLIEQHLSALPAPAPKLVKVPVPASPRLVRAAKAVAEAVERLELAKFSSEERPARIALERAARSLRSTLREERSHG